MKCVLFNNTSIIMYNKYYNIIININNYNIMKCVWLHNKSLIIHNIYI
jgi:hypothetical protein